MHSPSFNTSSAQAQTDSLSDVRSDPVSGRESEHRIRLLLVEELSLFRASLAYLLGSEPGFNVTGECGSSAEALDLLKSAAPDVILLDFEVGTDHGTDFMAAARQANYQGHFLIVASALDARKSALSLRVGASGVFLKCDAPERLLRAIKVVAEGGLWVDPKVIQLLAEQLIDQYPLWAEASEERGGQLLDERESSVLRGILRGLSNRRIGDKLGMSESLVKNVIQRLFTKAGVRTRSQLVRAALDGSLGGASELMKWRTLGPGQSAATIGQLQD